MRANQYRGFTYPPGLKRYGTSHARTAILNLYGDAYPKDKEITIMVNDSSSITYDISLLTKKIMVRWFLGLVVVLLLLFLPAGSWRFWEAWLYTGVLFIPMLFVVRYFVKTDPALLERRLKWKEPEPGQKTLIKLATGSFFIGFLLPGFDYRYQWSTVPLALVLASNTMVFLGYLLFFLVLRENSYASRVIEVEQGQKVITTGPYAVVRHPMYLGVLIMFLFTPLALGSVWAMLPFLPLVPVLVFRIVNEEQVLIRELPGYAAYCQQTRYRLVPFVW
jgi:protein-S-isoprenylcysteine O-methyltransferase Ste14